MASDPYVRPTLTALQAQAISDIQTSGLPGAQNILSRAVLVVMSWVMAGFAWLGYDYLDFIYQQSNPWDATGAAALGWGTLKGVQPKAAATAGTNGLGLGQWQGTPGTPLASGTIVYRTGDGFEYETTAAGTWSGTTVTAPLLASGPGVIGNAAVGVALSIGTPIPGINSTGIVSAALTDGSTAEDIDTAYKARYLAQYAAPPQGGDAADYVEWTEAVPNVTRAWVSPNGNGPGTVVVYPMFDESEAAFGGFPQGVNGVATNETRDTPAIGDQLTVANALFPLRPVTALVYVCAPTAEPVNFTITNLLPNTATITAGIQAALSDMFLRLGNVGGTINPATMAPWPAIYPSDINAAIDSVPGIQHYTLAAPSGPLTPGVGQLFTLGTLTATA